MDDFIDFGDIFNPDDEAERLSRRKTAALHIDAARLLAQIRQLWAVREASVATLCVTRAAGAQR